MADELQSGTILGGRYRLGERLGAGGWGSVYAAVQTDLGRPVAIKVLHISVALASDGLARFEREAKAAAALGHPNIAQVSDFQARQGEPPFLVMELLTGQTLGAVMRASRRIAPTRMAWIAYQILAGLDVAHRAGITHRDIKPDNVFLVSMPGVEDFVKLLDFGIAKLAGDSNAHLTSTGTMLGSPAFMAPEQVRSHNVDHRADIYALGATMYLALSGRMAFEAETVHGLLLAITEQRPIPLHVLDPSIDPALSAVVERAMHKDPAGRFGSAAEMRGALEPWLGGMASHASATANGPRLVSPASMTAGAPFAPPTAPPYGPSPAPPYGPPTSPPYGPSLAPPYGSPPTAGVALAPSPSYGATPGAAYSYSPNQGQYAPSITPPVGPMLSAAPAPPPAKSGGALVGLLVAVVALLLVLVGGGIAGFLYFRATRDGSVAATGPSSAASPSGAPAAATAATAAPPGAPTATTAAGAAGGRPGPKTAAATPGAAAPGGAAAGAAPVAIVTDAGAAAGGGGTSGGGAGGAKKQFAGSSFSVSGGSFGSYPIDASKAAIMARGGSISACYAATEFDAPDHQFTNWTFQVDPAGNVKSVGRTTNFELHPKFDACMIGALRQVKWPAIAGGGSPQVAFNSRTRDNP